MQEAREKYEVIEFKNEEEYIKEFLALPKRIYSKREIMQNQKEEEQILKGTHILSKYFTVYPFILMDKKLKKVVARAILTFYPDDENAYIGYYECINDINASQVLLEEVEKFARRNGYKKIIGPLNASFWIGYRFKMNNFGIPYMCEPYNKEYYPKFFENSGYEIYAEYTSNKFSKVDIYQTNSKFSNRLKQMRDKGYEFVIPTEESFDGQLRLIGDSILNLYSNFPLYKKIDIEEFYEMFKDLNRIIDYDMVKLAYFKDELVGFFVAVPDYSNGVNRRNYLKIVKTKMLKKQYILMYLGVKKEHLGLGSALAECMKEELKKNRATSIGALIKKGNANKAYFKELITDEYRYALFSKQI